MHKHISKHEETKHLANDIVHYREYKILLQPERFSAKEGFADFWEVVSKTLKKLGIKFDIDDRAFHSQVREVLFYDTPEFDLFNNHFILRKRTFYDEGWPRSDHELAFKFRDPDIHAAAGVDVRPHLGGHDQIKFKEELLLKRDQLGGMRSVYSHGCVLISPNIELERGIEDITSAFPTLQRIDIRPRTRMALVNNIAVEEVQNTMGMLHFGHHFKGKTTIAIWRSRALEKSLSGEFAFQCKFDRFEDVDKEAIELSEEFYKKVQLDCAEWVKLGTTKTAMVYAMCDDHHERLTNHE
ncbi:MAG TPA: hypothetical protein VMB26_07950 [Candidatus Binataceae bacterium]|nr:hypothetical protein [Candidatus Binataceae bacterium]